MEKQSRQSSFGVEREYGMESGIRRIKLDSKICLLSLSLRQFFDTILCTHRKVRNYKVRGIDNGIPHRLFSKPKWIPLTSWSPKYYLPISVYSYAHFSATFISIELIIWFYCLFIYLICVSSFYQKASSI